MDIKEIVEKLSGYLKGIWRFRWFALANTIVFAVIGWVVVALIPDFYKAHSKVYIDTQSLIQPLMRDISVTLDPDVRIQKMTRMLLSWPNLERIAQMSDLDLQYHSKAEKEEFLKKLEHDIKFKQSGNSNLYLLSYEHTEPEVAKLVVQSVLNLFMEMTLSDTRTDTVVAQKFLDQQLDQYETRLITAEQSLAQFKRNHIDHLPRQDQTYYEQLQSLLAQLEQTRIDLNIAKSRQAALDDQMRGEAPMLGLTSAQDFKTLHPLIRNLRERESVLEKLEQLYTQNHPDVIAVKNEIRSLNQRIENEQNDVRWEYTAEELNKNPVYQQIKIQYAEATAEVAAMQSQYDELNTSARLMETKVDQIIDAEAKLANLNRDYQMNHQHYQALLQKREAAKLAEDIDDTSENMKFRIIDPPFVTSLPSWPKRGLFNLVVLLGSMVGGIGVALLITQVKPVYYDRVSIENSLQLPVLSIIPFEKDMKFQQTMRAQNIAFAVAMLFLIGSCVILYVRSAMEVL